MPNRKRTTISYSINSPCLPSHWSTMAGCRIGLSISILFFRNVSFIFGKVTSAVRFSMSWQTGMTKYPWIDEETNGGRHERLSGINRTAGVVERKNLTSKPKPVVGVNGVFVRSSDANTQTKRKWKFLLNIRQTFSSLPLSQAIYRFCCRRLRSLWLQAPPTNTTHHVLSYQSNLT